MADDLVKRVRDSIWQASDGTLHCSLSPHSAVEAASEIERLLAIEQRAKAQAHRLRFDSSDRACIVDNILTGATWRDGIRIDPKAATREVENG